MTVNHSDTAKNSRELLIPQDRPRCCDHCGKIYTKKAKDAFLKEGGSITCTRCSATREFSITTKAVLLQPVIIEKNGWTGILTVSPDDTVWTLPNGCIRINESAEDTLIRATKESFGITLSPYSLRHFFACGNPKAQEYLSFYCHTTRLYEKGLSVKNAGFGFKTFLIIQTTDGIAFESPIYRDVAEKFLVEIWGRHPCF